MKTAIAVGILSLAVLCLSPLTQAQSVWQQPVQTYQYQYNLSPWQNAQNTLNQASQWGQQWQQNFQQQQLYNDYQWQQYQYQHQQAQWLKPYQVSPYSYNEPEVYAPRVAIPGGDVLLEPGDDQ